MNYGDNNFAHGMHDTLGALLFWGALLGGVCALALFAYRDIQQTHVAQPAQHAPRNLPEGNTLLLR